MDHSPFDRIKLSSKVTPKRKRVYFSIKEVTSILEDAKQFNNSHFYPIIFLAASTGARRSEVLNLTKSDIDLNLRLIHIRNTKTKLDRVIRMNDSLFHFLQEQIKKSSTEFVVPAPEGIRFSNQRISRWVEKFRKRHPREKHFGLHTLRHSFAFNFLKSGGEMYQLKAILGHRTIQMTIDLYGQLQAQDVDTPNLYQIS